MWRGGISESTMPDRGHSAITRCVGALRAAGATDADEYEQRLRSNADEPEVLEDFLLEGFFRFCIRICPYLYLLYVSNVEGLGFGSRGR